MLAGEQLYHGVYSSTYMWCRQHEDGAATGNLKDLDLSRAEAGSQLSTVRRVAEWCHRGACRRERREEESQTFDQDSNTWRLISYYCHVHSEILTVGLHNIFTMCYSELVQ